MDLAKMCAFFAAEWSYSALDSRTKGKAKRDVNNLTLPLAKYLIQLKRFDFS